MNEYFPLPRNELIAEEARATGFDIHKNYLAVRKLKYKT